MLSARALPASTSRSSIFPLPRLLIIPLRDPRDRISRAAAMARAGTVQVGIRTADRISANLDRDRSKS
jgi:hypothetical protein